MSFGYRTLVINSARYFISIAEYLISIFTFEVIPFIEFFEVKLLARQTFPQSQIYTIKCVISWNRVIISFCHNLFTRFPNCLFFVINKNSSGMSIKVNNIFDITSLNLPRISIFKPIIRYFDLIPIYNLLHENSIIISYAIAPSRIIQSCH